jgi:hypothetical protein
VRTKVKLANTINHKGAAKEGSAKLFYSYQNTDQVADASPNTGSLNHVDKQ